jgi:ABC-2 type transport system ATP-binding protein
VTPPGTRWLEIHSPEGAALLERLHDVPGVHQATIFGQAIHALVDDGHAPADFGLNAADVRLTDPTLEDVFVTLTRAQANGKDGGA